MSIIENKIVINWIMSLVILFIALTSLVFFNYQDYVLVYGYQEEQLVNIYLTEQEISQLTNKLKYEGNTLEFDIMEISKDYILDNNKLKRNVKISFDFKSDNPILGLYLEIGKKINIWQKIWKKYMKGMM